MADTFQDFKSSLGGTNQLVFVAENSETVTDWVAKLSVTVEEHNSVHRRLVTINLVYLIFR